MASTNERESEDFNHLFEAPQVAQISYPEIRPKTPPQKNDQQQQSKWMNWSKNRRRSYQERMKKLEERLAAEEKLKHNTSRQAIKKAKKEASKFVDPEYASKMKQEKLRTISAQVDDRLKVFDSESESEDEDALKKAAEELKESRCHGIIRKVGLLCSFLALLVVILALGLGHWTTHAGAEGKILRGLWSETVNVTTSSGSSTGSIDRHQWHNAVIGLLSASGIMNLLGCLLALSGICSVLFLKKLYYYHSAAEAFIVASITMGCAILMFFVIHGRNPSPPLVGIGPSPALACIGLALQVVTAIIMNLDILIDQFRRCGKRNTPSPRM